MAANDAGASAVRAAAATYDPRRGAGRAAYAAGYAALNATKAAAEAAADVADIVIAVEAGVSEAGVVQAGDELVSADVARHTGSGLAIRGDLSALMSGLPPDRLARMPLWQPDEMSVAISQGRAFASWMRLQSALPRISKHWRVWVTWYNYVLAGSPPSPARSEAWEAAFTDVPGPLPWDDGPEAVNLEIRKRLDALASPNNKSQASLAGTL